ncbi:hypothetical protein MO867_06320 [Microbulbifer sp. OS29]|uniref:Dipeptidyl aminopeptidase/acylaminoacyl peptidase n=1 Tax=Microbulbifer okhotskensis TaxID=2926617 RepID=A0A9X2EQN5_9GAMM|nr:hypothetical protein [Microbulbifer okhotskensis]MCO1333953.1 hypothetical protein [Microbulbifer okhotskensis]
MRVILFVFSLWPSLVLSAQVTLEDLVRHTEVEEVKISPTGTHLAIRKLHEGERVLIFMSIKPLKVTGLLRFRGSEEVGDFYWANDERVVAEVMSRKAALEAPVVYGSLYAINSDGTKAKNIFGYLAGERQVGTRFKKAKATYAHATIIDPLLNNKNEILISTRPWARNQESIGEVLRLNIYKGTNKHFARLPQIDGRAYTDGAGNLIYADGTDKDNNYQLFSRSSQNWQKIDSSIMASATPLGFDPNSKEAYLAISPESQTKALIKVKHGSEDYSIIFQHARTDLHGIIYPPNSYKPLGVYLHPEYPVEHFFDEGEGFSAFFRGLKRAFQDYRIGFTSFTSDGSLGVLKVHGDRLPGDYYLVNLKSKSVDFLISSANWLEPEQLNPMLADSFTTEDKFQVGVYLTFPKNSKKKNPMVVLPHGGPHSRDY